MTTTRPPADPAPMSGSDERPRRPHVSARAFWLTARRPQWIAALVLALGVAAGFAALGQWQASRSFENAIISGTDTETPVTLAEIADSRYAVKERAVGRLVTVEGELVPGDFVVLTGRQENGETRAWLVGRIMADDKISLAVALGSAPDAETAARAAAAALAMDPNWEGRYLPSESPQESDFESGEQSALSIAALVNQWGEFNGRVYGGYLVSAEAPEGLEPIFAPAPEQEVVLNWLNVFYAVEWALFAGFAIYLWYRLVRDAVERTADVG